MQLNVTIRMRKVPSLNHLSKSEWIDLPGKKTFPSRKKLRMLPKCFPLRSIMIHPSESVSTSMRPENMALSMVSCFVRVPIVVLKREPPTFILTYIDGAPLITPPVAVAAAADDVASRGEAAEFDNGITPWLSL